MRILSVDVGIKNLAYCVIKSHDNSFIIEQWNVLNLCIDQNNLCNICKKKAYYSKDNNYYCKIHAKKTNFKLPTSAENINLIKKLKINNLFELAHTYDISFNKPILKDKIIELITEYIKQNYLEPIREEKTNDYNLIDLGINLKKKLDQECEVINLLNIDKIIIENQISPIATRMKTLQGMIAQYFIMKNLNNIEFISAYNKLKQFIGNKNTTYNERKKLSIEITNNILIKHNSSLITFFNQNSKKDDLADCFLQAIYYLTEKEKINI